MADMFPMSSIPIYLNTDNSQVDIRVSVTLGVYHVRYPCKNILILSGSLRDGWSI